MSKPKDFSRTLSSLTDSLDELEDVLEPLLDRSLAETMAGLDAIQKAKLSVLMAYTIQDVLFGVSRAFGLAKGDLAEVPFGYGF